MRHEAIRALYDTVVTIDDDAGAFDKDGNKVTLDESAITAKIAELQTAYDNLEYQRKRAFEYPSIVDQLDDIYHNGIDGWKATIKVVKDKYPKS
tara:strand:+ start:621 stop:902 length:282 start_codon:yes stop_codon:yes gene_type:complete